MNKVLQKKRRQQLQAEYEKVYAALEDSLIEYGYAASLVALRHSKRLHNGFRKDGITSAHMHQVRIATRMLHRRRGLKEGGIDPDTLIAIALLHDTPEENQNLGKSQIRKWFKEVAAELTDEVVDGAFALSKIRNGIKLDAEKYYNELSENMMYMLVKLYDRIDNLSTILALPPDKQPAYVKETELLLTIAGSMHTRNRRLDEVIYDCRAQIELGLANYLGFAWEVLHGRGDTIVGELEKGGLLPKHPEEPTWPDPENALVPG